MAKSERQPATTTVIEGQDCSEAIAPLVEDLTEKINCFIIPENARRSFPMDHPFQLLAYPFTSCILSIRTVTQPGKESFFDVRHITDNKREEIEALGSHPQSTTVILGNLTSKEERDKIPREVTRIQMPDAKTAARSDALGAIIRWDGQKTFYESIELAKQYPNVALAAIMSDNASAFPVTFYKDPRWKSSPQRLLQIFGI